MATINGATSSTIASAANPTPASLKQAELGKNDFLNLLVTQLKNQDPLKPMDSSSFVAELAQFSQLEQSSNQSTLLGKVLDAQNSSLQYSLLPLIGRDVRVEGAIIPLGSGPAPLDYNLNEDAVSVRASILNASNQTIRTLDLGSQSAGEQHVVWDGRDGNGTLMPPGTYTYSVAARNSQNQPVPITATSRLTVSGIRVVEGQPRLAAGENTIDPSAVIEFR
ncbi:MAG: flagellar hook assembly protein FlgD [Nitrospirota bacterium]|nr:flagellar hook assembly protein FlgD [Nitrospirota bacterium]